MTVEEIRSGIESRGTGTIRIHSGIRSRYYLTAS